MLGSGRLFLAIGALLGGVAFVAPHAWSQSNIQNVRRERADEIWRKLSEIIHLRGQRPSRADIEQIFNVHLTELYVQPSFGGRAFAIREPNYDLQLEEMRDGGRHFMFFWSGTTTTNPYAFPPPPDGMCVTRQVVMRSLAQQGWVVVTRSNSLQEGKLGMSDVTLQADRALLGVNFTIGTDCFEALSIQTGLDAGRLPPLKPQSSPSAR